MGLARDIALTLEFYGLNLANLASGEWNLLVVRVLLPVEDHRLVTRRRCLVHNNVQQILGVDSTLPFSRYLPRPGNSGASNCRSQPRRWRWIGLADHASPWSAPRVQLGASRRWQQRRPREGGRRGRSLGVRFEVSSSLFYLMMLGDRCFFLFFRGLFFCPLIWKTYKILILAMQILALPKIVFLWLWFYIYCHILYSSFAEVCNPIIFTMDGSNYVHKLFRLDFMT